VSVVSILPNEGLQHIYRNYLRFLVLPIFPVERIYIVGNSLVGTLLKT
jgi:hypothetical protein